MTIKGEIKALNFQGIKYEQLLQGFYIRNSTGLTNGKPSWTHENGIDLSIWFDGEGWMVGDTKIIGLKMGYLMSSTSQDNSLPQEAKNWEYADISSDKLIMSSDISIKRGTYVAKLYL